MNKTAEENREDNTLLNEKQKKLVLGAMADYAELEVRKRTRQLMAHLNKDRAAQSIAFQKWTHHSGYRPVTDPMDPVVIYERNCSRFSVEELYEIFLKRK